MALRFAAFPVATQAFYRTALAYAIVNRRPIVPGHVLVIPTRVVQRLADLTQPELADLMSAVQLVGRVIEKAYGADALTVACQDGKAAGQSVPHVHFHILPRKFSADHFAARPDDVYPALERAEAALPHHLDRRFQPLAVDDDRTPRSLSEMEREADWLRSLFPSTS